MGEIRLTKAFSGKPILECEYCGKKYVNYDAWVNHSMKCEEEKEIESTN